MVNDVLGLIVESAVPTFERYLAAADAAHAGEAWTAEEGIRLIVAELPDFAVARFQLAQLLAIQEKGVEASEHFSMLAPREDALGAYARAFHALLNGRVDVAIAEFSAGTDLPQENQPLADDMKNFVSRLRESNGLTEHPQAASSTLLAGYGRSP